jgi:hypothetical protein
MSIGAISPVSPARPREGSTDHPGHQTEQLVDQAEQQADRRRHHEREPEEWPPPADASKPGLDQLV